MPLARLFESLPLVCPNCGADMRIIAFVTETVPVQRILAHIGEPTEPPPIAPARGPPAWDEAPEPAPDWDRLNSPSPTSSLISALRGSRRLSQATVRLSSSPGSTLHRSSEPRHPTARAPHRLRHPSAPLFGVDHTFRPRYRPLPSHLGQSGWLGFPVRLDFLSVAPETVLTKATLVTGWTPDLSVLARISVPFMERYAAAHVLEFEPIEFNGNLAGFEKLPPLLRLLRDGREVIWVDIDVLMLGSADLREDLPIDRPLCLAYHEGTNVLVPHYNTGVMVLRPDEALIELLDRAYRLGVARQVRHPWHDQAAILQILGYYSMIVNDKRADAPDPRYSALIGRLDVDFNSIVGFCVGNDPQFHHYAGLRGMWREKVMRVDADHADRLRGDTPDQHRAYASMMGVVRHAHAQWSSALFSIPSPAEFWKRFCDVKLKS